MRRPFIGITGFMSKRDIAEIEALFPKKTEAPGFEAGILVSQKTLGGGTNSHGHKYPRREDISGLLLERGPGGPRFGQFIHYCSDMSSGSDLVLELLACLGLLRGRSMWLTGFQLNLRRPPHLDDLMKFKELTQGAFEIILQLNHSYIYPGQMPYSPDMLVRQLRPYLPGIDHVLFDLSGGNGKPLVVGAALPYIDALHGLGKIGVGIAGGLSADTLDTVRPILEKHPTTFIDAEGRVAKQEERVRYVEKALAIYQSLTTASRA